jgi:hypothetical protein
VDGLPRTVGFVVVGIFSPLSVHKYHMHSAHENIGQPQTVGLSQEKELSCFRGRLKHVSTLFPYRPSGTNTLATALLNNSFLCTRSFSIKSEAVLKIAQYLQLPLPAAAALALAFPLRLRDTVYDNIAERRYDFFGKSNECRLSDGTFESRFLS